MHQSPLNSWNMILPSDAKQSSRCWDQTPQMSLHVMEASYTWWHITYSGPDITYHTTASNNSNPNNIPVSQEAVMYK